MKKEEAEETLKEFERLISYKKHFECQIEMLDRRVLFALRELAGIEITDDMNDMKKWEDRKQILKQIIKQRRLDEKALSDYKMTDFIEELTKK